MYKMLRKLTKLLERMRKANDDQNWSECVSSAQLVIDMDKNAHSFISKGKSAICMCQSKAKNTKDAISACEEVLKQNPNDADALYYRAQAYIVDELLDKAQQDCQKAHEVENSQRTSECIDKINKLIKQSKKRDYYKILGVKRSADKKAIIKAYRKMAHVWHPGKYRLQLIELSLSLYIYVC